MPKFSCCSGLNTYNNFAWLDELAELDNYLTVNPKTVKSGCLAFLPTKGGESWTSRIQSLHLRVYTSEVYDRRKESARFMARTLFDKCKFVWIDNCNELRVRSFVLGHWPPRYALFGEPLWEETGRVEHSKEGTSPCSGFLVFLYASRPRRFLRIFKRTRFGSGGPWRWPLEHAQARLRTLNRSQKLA